MTRYTFARPPHILNHEGNPRRVGIEIEFGSVSTEVAAKHVQQLFDGDLQEDDRHRFHIHNTRLGDFLVELDSQYVHRVDGNGDAGEGKLVSRLRTVLGNVSELVVPNEIVCPPIEIENLPELETLTDSLVAIGASGTSASAFYAFGCQLNPEIAAKDVSYILSMLRAYLLMSPWLRAVIELDLTRRIVSFADPFPDDYARRICDAAYAPSMSELIDDYLAFNPTRNRELDMLPLFAWLDEARVTARLDDTRINKRPTFHYRLPDAKIGQPDWSLALEWNRWCVVERLAADTDRLSAMCEAFLSNNNKLVSSNWAVKSTEWLLT
jgi:hypothetical protein